MADYDLAIIGGGLNGVSVARDAAGRGLRVILLEQGDLGSAASSASPRLIHGDLAVLERRAFLRVRAALAERDIWLRIAPHLVRPMRFAIPAHSDERPSWLLRSGLLLYDRLASRSRLPGSATVDVTHHPIGNALKRPFGTAFEYSDCVVDDSRLVIANAVDAAERGAVIRTGARCVRADRLDVWRLAVIDRGHRRVITARALANASGAWTASVAETVLRLPPPRAGAIQISQIVVRRLFETDNVYVFQNADRRLIFASPYERDFTLIGTVGHAFKGDPAAVSMAAADVAYLCDAANRYFRERVEPSDVIRTISGANMAVDPASRHAARDGAMTVRYAGRQGAAADDLRRRRHDLAAARGAGGLEAHAILSDVAALDREGAAAGRRFCLGAVRRGGRSRARALAVSRRGRGAASGRRLRLASCGRPWRGQRPGRPRSGLRAGTDGRGGALSHGEGMGALSGRHSLAALEARPDHAARRIARRWRRSWRRRCEATATILWLRAATWLSRGRSAASVQPRLGWRGIWPRNYRKPNRRTKMPPTFRCCASTRW